MCVSFRFHRKWSELYGYVCITFLPFSSSSTLKKNSLFVKPKDINECANSTLNDCGANSTCSNTIGSCVCACSPGYYGDGVTCTNYNECAGENGGNNCAATATCASIPGSFSCACYPGYTGNGTSCTGIAQQLDFSVQPFWKNCVRVVDIDECTLNTDNCNNATATCTNTPGSYSCACNSGYYGDGVTCTDYNECAGQNGGNNCNVYSTCTNTPGSFSCACNSGFAGNGVNCTGLLFSLSPTFIR